MKQLAKYVLSAKLHHPHFTDEEVRLEEVNDWCRVTEQVSGHLGTRLSAL